MAGASLLTLLDDIATILDDVAVMSKVAAKKTAGVLGDDLALNAQQVTGVNADRELPVVWAVAKGSFLNKLILVPAALLISAFAPWLVTPLLMFGGLFLCFEGFEKLWHSKAKKHASGDDAPKDAHEALVPAGMDPKEYEKQKVKGAIRTDFVLSAEIIAITLGVVAEHPFMTQVVTLSIIAVVMTIGVYGLVAGIVKLDDVGLWLSKKASSVARAFGSFLLAAAPKLMKLLSIVGTAAMFMVGGGILTHGIAAAHHAIEAAAVKAGAVTMVGPLLALLTPSLLNLVFGVIAGALALMVMSAAAKLMGKSAH
ncbi:DUF808 family protein [Shewanella sp. JM162201]|uniref:DUF808 family protein n=1 Tax=Shewanella jiangmenensis TaxID=2837387 RepID=A0ABS5UZD2_9GAMM|nr:DUF808 domain-containing protein [Shewanella jiangmenensis]MBT1443549.1 DUF808 family protein [Shewanella jiangmenensis]